MGRNRGRLFNEIGMIHEILEGRKEMMDNHNRRIETLERRCDIHGPPLNERVGALEARIEHLEEVVKSWVEFMAGVDID